MRERSGGADEISALEKRIGYTFKNKDLAGEALTHASRSHETPGTPCNERLEFLGDAVLGFLVADHLYRNYPHMPEGRMTSARACVVSKPSLARIAADLGFRELIRVGRGMGKAGKTRNETVLSDAVEAVLAAIYLDSGLQQASGFILPLLADGIVNAAEEGHLTDGKSRLQELLQRKGEVRIEYALDDASGPPHDRMFTVSVSADGKRLAQGTGKSKKAAQQHAAGEALRLLAQETNESGTSQRAPEKA